MSTRTNFKGEEMLVNESNNTLTHEESIALFQKVEELEHKLYRKIFSFKPFTTRFLEELLNFMTTHDAEKSESFKDDLNSLITRSLKPNPAFRSDLDAFCSRLIALDGPRYVARLAVKLSSALAAEDYDFIPAGKWSEAQHAAWHREVVRLFNAAHAVKNRLVAANQGLVGLIVKRYGAVASTALAMADMQQEGALGLYRAIDKFEWRRGLRFSTYATWWIRHHVTRAIGDKSSLIRLPIHMEDSIKQIKRFAVAFHAKNGRQPTISEIMKETSFRKETVKYAVEQRVSVISIDADIKGVKNNSLSTGEGRSFHELTPDPKAEMAADNMEQIETREILMRAISALTPREQEVVKFRFGVTNGASTDNTITLNEVGIKFGLSRERIRQLESQALRKLRNNISKHIPSFPN